MAKGAAYELVMEMGVRRAEAARRPVSVGIKISDRGSGPRSFFQGSRVTLGPQLPLSLNLPALSSPLKLYLLNWVPPCSPLCLHLHSPIRCELRDVLPLFRGQAPSTMTRPRWSRLKCGLWPVFNSFSLINPTCTAPLINPGQRCPLLPNTPWGSDPSARFQLGLGGPSPSSTTQRQCAYPLYLSGPCLQVYPALTGALGLCWCLESGHRSLGLACWT